MYKVRLMSNREKLNVKRLDKDFESKEKAERYLRSMTTYIPEEFFGYEVDEEDEDAFETAYMCNVKEEGEVIGPFFCCIDSVEIVSQGVTDFDCAEYHELMREKYNKAA